ncbi:hypothetical protein FHX34_103390 [Actinoplanes teichomyceticus]|uniref:Uncharacterized protein n=1 Tax=Actinoplanes teichomyceticus TaxID=1867 RepID=A0A561WAH1_ACTTI|nr:hypothetical protein FHX34_103390 [Actinoplanes teichomyceticus]GIF14522.1 hypothetical protein Ate01nite_45540 [Actinoplanes teichomyceticus]
MPRATPDVREHRRAPSASDKRSASRAEVSAQRLLNGRIAILSRSGCPPPVGDDRMIVVGDDGILEHGNHDELISASGRYAGMYATEERLAAGS